jgi:hypothetical protein
VSMVATARWASGQSDRRTTIRTPGVRTYPRYRRNKSIGPRHPRLRTRGHGVGNVGNDKPSSGECIIELPGSQLTVAHSLCLP